MFYGYSMYYSNPNYLIGMVLVLIGSILMIYAQAKVKSAYSKYSKVANNKGITGASIAREILDSHGLHNVSVNSVSGVMSDHYNPSTKQVNLSTDVYGKSTISAIAIASHECGHAIQDQVGYTPLKIRSLILPVCNIGQSIGWIAVMIGFLTNALDIAILGVILMSGILVFQIVTLPVEFNASSRALKILEDRYVSKEESIGIKSVLSAAAFTYVASMLGTLLSLLRLVLLIVGRRNND